SQPQDTDPTGVDRGGIYFMLSNWPQQDIRNEASIIIGYPFAAESIVSVTIDNDETFSFFTINDGAWLSDRDQENDLVVAMQRGLEMSVRGRSQRGTDTTDTYSLRGATAAINGALQECAG
ncbi:MAG: invasion associated locus B family protein, partial [Alphaproteobacteria bacterium]